MPIINFSDNAAMFLLLNILGHDPIHDYNDYNSNRWSKCQKYLQQMGQIVTIGGTITKTKTGTTTGIVVKSAWPPGLPPSAIFPGIGRSTGTTSTTTSNREGRPVSRILQKDNRKLRAEIMKQKRMRNYLKMRSFLEEFFEHIKNQVILNAMHFIFFYKISRNVQQTIPSADIFLIRYSDTYVNDDPETAFVKPTIVPVDLDRSLENTVVVNTYSKEIQAKIIQIITKDFYIFAKYCLGIDDFLDMYHLIECLNNYLLTERILTIVKDSIETRTFGFLIDTDEPDYAAESMYGSDDDDDDNDDDDNDDDGAMDGNGVIERDLVLEDFEDGYMSEGGKPRNHNFKMTGGAAVKLLPLDDDAFIIAINDYWTTLQQDPVFINFNDDVFVMAYTDYDVKRNKIIDDICNIAIANGMPDNSIPYLRANMKRLYPRQLKRAPRKPSKLPDRIKEAIFFSTIDSQKRIITVGLDASAAAKKKEMDDAAAAVGALTSDEKKGVSDFMKFIARFVLWAMQICDLTGQPIPNPIVAAVDPLLLKQIDCLKAVAEWGPTLANKDIDTRLITNFFNFYSQNVNIFKEDDANACKPATPNVNKKYIINNAASIGYLQKKVFCPTSSIVDAMTSTCTWSTSADQGREAGNLDYTIAGAAGEAGFRYQGKATFIGNPVPNQPLIIAAPGTTNYIESILVATLPNGIVIQGGKTIHIPTSTELTAHVALKHTLVVVIEKMYALTTATPTFFTAPTQPGAAPWGIWGRLFDYGVTEVNNQFFKDLFAELLFKGRGDLDQEINAAIKWGGYEGNPRNIQYGHLIVPHDQASGEAMRYFVANDRPSACRFMFMLLNAPADKVNRLAFGGYYSDRKRVLVKHPRLGPGCRIQGAAGGSRKRKSIKNKKSKKRSHRKKQTKRYITKTNRKTRKNKSRKH